MANWVLIIDTLYRVVFCYGQPLLSHKFKNIFRFGNFGSPIDCSGWNNSINMIVLTFNEPSAINRSRLHEPQKLWLIDVMNPTLPRNPLTAYVLEVLFGASYIHWAVNISVNGRVWATKTYRYAFQGEFSFDEVNHLQIRHELLVVPSVAFEGHVLDESHLDLVEENKIKNLIHSICPWASATRLKCSIYVLTGFFSVQRTKSTISLSFTPRITTQFTLTGSYLKNQKISDRALLCNAD